MTDGKKKVGKQLGTGDITSGNRTDTVIGVQVG